LGVRWQWIDHPARLLRLPRTKNSLPHDVPLSDYALRVLNELATARQSDWIIPQSISPEKPLRTDTLGSLVRDRQVQEQRISGRTKSEAGLFLLPGGTWTAHDLRRTAASRLQELGTEPHLIEAILHHVPSKLIRTYQTYDDLPARRRALDLLGSTLGGLDQGKAFGADVIPLKTSA
jgi:integrase